TTCPSACRRGCRDGSTPPPTTGWRRRVGGCADPRPSPVDRGARGRPSSSRSPARSAEAAPRARQRERRPARRRGPTPDFRPWCAWSWSFSVAADYAIMAPMKNALVLAMFLVAAAAQAQTPAAVPTPTDVKPGSINCEECPYPYPSSYLPLTLYGQDVRIAYMDVAPSGAANGHTVVLLHGNNFAGFYFGGPIDVLRKEGFRVIVPDQIGYGRSSKPIIPYTFTDMARNTRAILQSLKIERVMVVGHSM